MAINIKFDLVGNPEPPTIILANRNGNKLGQLNIDTDSIEISDKFIDAPEFSFTIRKKELSLSEEENDLYREFLRSSDNFLLRDTNGLYLIAKDSKGFILSKDMFEFYLWDKIIDFKLVYCKEWDKWFEINVELDETIETVKTVYCTQLGQAELSQIMLYNVEINTEKDIERDDYKISILYDKDNPKASILHRLLEKAPHYSIDYVSPSIANIQRQFSFDGTSICDAFNEVAEEIGCLFVYNSNTDENGKISRTVSVYDLWCSCGDCGYRHESEEYFMSNSHIYLTDELDNMLTDELENYLLYKLSIECPKCGGKHITTGYGDDTLIFVTSDELASNGIQLVSDPESVKNCFKLEAGDDLMTATIRNCNPNGTDYIWNFSDDVKEDMSGELVNRIESYDRIYEQYYKRHVSDVDTTLVDRYNALVKKYSVYNDNLQQIVKPIVGYPALMNAYYNTIDLALYLKSGLMPSVEMTDTTAAEQASLLTVNELSPVAVADADIASLATINSAMLAMAKIIVRSTYKVQVHTSELYDSGSTKYWNGNFIITNYSDDEDTAISETVYVQVSDDLETYIRQKIEKALNKENTDDLSITGLFAKEYDVFCEELKKYALNPLVSFRDACQACIDILIEQGVSNGSGWSDNNSGSDGNLYDNLYAPYYNKLKAIEAEIKIREDEISIISGVYDVDGNIVSNGLQVDIEKHRAEIQSELNFEDYLGEELWLEFCAYRREDKYLNDNYISDGLNNAELFSKALEFFEVAESEIYKSSQSQYSISTTLNNLLAIPKFKNLVKSFKVGNWIRVRVDDKIFKLRLLEYGIDFGSFNDISVEFSNVTKIKNGTTDVQNILSRASSMSTSYGSVQRQAGKGAKSNSVLDGWTESGLNATNIKIVGTNNQNQVWDRNGILCREYDPISDTYSNEQLKIINSTIAITDDNWETTKTAIGKHYYTDPKTGKLTEAYGINGETIVGKLLIGERLDISNSSGNLEFGTGGLSVKNNVNSVVIDPNNSSIFNISNDNGNIFSLNGKGELVIIGNITASSLTLLDGTTIGRENITGLSDVAISGNYKDLTGVPTKLSVFENDTAYITKSVGNLDNYYKKSETYSNSETYKKTEVNNLLDEKANINDLSDVATSGSYNDLVDIEEFKKWILEQINAAVNQ